MEKPTHNVKIFLYWLLAIEHYFLMARQSFVGKGRVSSWLRFRDYNQTRVDKWSAPSHTPTWQHNTHKRSTSMPLAGFEPAIPARARPQTQALDRATTRIGIESYLDDQHQWSWDAGKGVKQFSMNTWRLLTELCIWWVMYKSYQSDWERLCQ
jgi:hypothetical protein